MATVTITEKVQVLVEIVEPDGTRFRDAIYMTAEERAEKTEKDLEALGAARHAAWKAATSAPPRPISRAEKRDMLEAALHEKARIEEEIAKADPLDLEEVRKRPGVPQDAVVAAEPLPVDPVKGR